MASLRFVAPAGAPLRIGDLARATATVLGGSDAGSALRRAIQARFGVKDAFLTATGRAGLTVLLQAIRRLPAASGRDEVIVPSYTCYSVAASIVKAGLRPRLVDVSTRSLSYETAALDDADFGRVLAVVATNLYGYPDDLEIITRIARARGAFVIDDAAQAMGARRDGREAGTRGDAGLFSLDKGKNVSAIDGGIVVTNSPEIAAALRAEMASLPSCPAGEALAGAAKAVVYWAMLRPGVYWIPNSLPQLGLGRTVFTTGFPLEKPSRFLTALACSALDHLEEFTRMRRRTAAALLDGLAHIPGVGVPVTSAGSEPACLRFPVLLPGSVSRDAVLASLNAAGIGATGSYPASLSDVPELAPMLRGDARKIRQGREIAARILTLPTHPYVGEADIARMVNTIGAAMGAAQRGMRLCVE